MMNSFVSAGGYQGSWNESPGEQFLKHHEVLSRTQLVFEKDYLCNFLTIFLLNAPFLKQLMVPAQMVEAIATKLPSQNKDQPCLPDIGQIP